MNFLHTIKWLYVINGFAAVALYVPQITAVIKDAKKAQSLSLVTFGGWGVGSIITSLYALLLIKDSMFAAISLANLAGQGTLCAIVIYRRLAIKRCPGRNPLSSPEFTA